MSRLAKGATATTRRRMVQYSRDDETCNAEWAVERRETDEMRC